ncbi:MAG: hypothetical protein ACRDYW_03580 [Acidimicrobiales bacterium]
MTDAMADPPATSFLDSLGPRGRRRAEPRTSIALAGAGCALAILGVLIVAGDTGAGDEGDFNQYPGAVLSALVVAGGFVALSRVRNGAVATAGAVAAALGVPPLMFFITFDESSLPPYSTDGILIVSTAAWLISYAIGPARGRPFFLSAGLIGLWLTILQLVEDVFEAPFGFFPFFGVSSEESFSETGMAIGPDGSFSDPAFQDPSSFDAPEPILPDTPSFDAPDPTTIGLLTLGLGVAFLLIGRYLDRRGHHGTATPFAFAALPTLLTAPWFLADDLEQAGTGLLLLLIGAGLAFHGASAGRRATAWFGGGVAAIGLAVFLGDMSDEAMVIGLLYVAAGIGMVAGGHAIAAALREPDEMDVTTGSPLAVVVTATASPSAPTSAPLPMPEPPADPTGPPAGDERDGDDHSDWAPPPDDTPPPPHPLPPE